ncbi:hypothetical protein BIW11_08760 [Tropilaelaps mercedesae]|uniref:Uncharacterized protein n=1 Tax=Tropilaelaps mercedesae TaxID=418985 RepID=A0A1V9XNC6_9ACAR|nr:hypothetical protein BIW11_08760 [Tropilaelaps mercedesae]
MRMVTAIASLLAFCVSSVLTKHEYVRCMAAYVKTFEKQILEYEPNSAQCFPPFRKAVNKAAHRNSAQDFIIRTKDVALAVALAIKPLIHCLMKKNLTYKRARVKAVKALNATMNNFDICQKI